eukprot:GILJ01006581.1.p1 GENE.GILJ01006581.1~~GILJ01006581.1.p1  ORF type:complete len:415 (-),score=61.66 GILJ01006581.1:555-1799(-)
MDSEYNKVHLPKSDASYQALKSLLAEIHGTGLSPHEQFTLNGFGGLQSPFHRMNESPLAFNGVSPTSIFGQFETPRHAVGFSPAAASSANMFSMQPSLSFLGSSSGISPLASAFPFHHNLSNLASMSSPSSFLSPLAHNSFLNNAGGLTHSFQAPQSSAFAPVGHETDFRSPFASGVSDMFKPPHPSTPVAQKAMMDKRSSVFALQQNTGSILGPTLTRREYHSKRGRPRGSVSRDSTGILKEWLKRHSNKPYPSKEEKRQLAKNCGMTEQQITTWFINARAKLKKDAKTGKTSGPAGAPSSRSSSPTHSASSTSQGPLPPPSHPTTTTTTSKGELQSTPLPLSAMPLLSTRPLPLSLPLNVGSRAGVSDGSRTALIPRPSPAMQPPPSYKPSSPPPHSSLPISETQPPSEQDT